MDISGTITESKSHVILVMYYLFYFYGTKMNMTFSRGLRISFRTPQSFISV